MIKWRTSKDNWHNADSEPTSIDTIIEKIRENDSYEIHVGCDSHRIGGVYIFAIVIAGYVPRRGGTFYFSRKKSEDDVLASMRFRLMKEAELALDIAHRLKVEFPHKKINVHLDINPNKKFPSSKVLTNAVSWVNSFGYNAIVKPNAWASSSLADAFAK